MGQQILLTWLVNIYLLNFAHR